MSVCDWPDVLRAAGVDVKVHPEVLRLSHGDLRDCNIVWHHDASPPGDSPGALDWMISSWDIASAQIWVDRRGVWHFISYGIAWHAGAVNDSAFDNWHAAGIETDHTTGEEWPAAQLEALRKGTAACLAHERKSSANLAFHKTICVPVGRKSDPDGLDLRAERAAVQALINTPSATTSAITQEDFLMALSQQDQEQTRNAVVDINNRTADMAKAIEALTDALRLHKPDGTPYPFNGLDGVNNNVVGLYALLSARAPSGDPVEVAKAVAAAIPADLAQRVADELSKRLAS